MTSYWLTNAGLSVLVLIGLLLLRSAPPRPKMWLCLAAAAAWCVPWPLLSSLWQSNDVFVQYVRVDVLQSLSPTVLAPVSPSFSVPWNGVFVGLMAIGLLLFVARIVTHQRQQRTWRNNAQAATDAWRRAGYPDMKVPILVVNGLENAFVSGYLRPRIWMGRSQLASPALRSILQHELAHIRQHDNLILLFATLLASLFWWNPLVRVLTRQVRHYVELSCDLACQKSSPNYREDLASELLNREYRMLESKLINPISRSRGFNVYRIRQLARETSMKLRHLVLLTLLAVTSVLLVSNTAISEVVEGEPQIVTHLTVTTVTTTSDGGKNTKSLETEIIAEPEIEKLLQLADTADVVLKTHMESEFRRVVVIESRNVAETRKVLAAFENSGLHNIFNSRAVRDTGRHIFLDLDFQVAEKPPYAVRLAPNIGEWTGVTVGDYLLRLKPDLIGDPGHETVLLSTEISLVGEDAFNLIATPGLTTKFGGEVVMRMGEGETALSLTLLPRLAFDNVVVH